MEKNDSQKKRSRGGQPGNTNALKHGFYTEQGRRRIEETDALLKDCRELLEHIAGSGNGIGMGSLKHNNFFNLEVGNGSL